ncbi:hypothetical protein [Alishewanella sp. HL-SH05]|uniref:hypothetical protein n=1 Tax=Alishewanella sp. HL-SH05 TaxID=3461145 RepID=UPI004041785A
MMFDGGAKAPIGYFTRYYDVVETLSLSLGSMLFNLSKNLNQLSSHIFIKNPSVLDIDDLDIFGMTINWFDAKYAYALRLTLYDHSGLALTGSELPLLLDLFDVSDALNSFSIVDKTTLVESSFVGDLRNIQTVSVTEPSSFLLFVLTFCLMLALTCKLNSTSKNLFKRQVL